MSLCKRDAEKSQSFITNAHESSLCRTHLASIAAPTPMMNAVPPMTRMLLASFLSRSAAAAGLAFPEVTLVMREWKMATSRGC